jgi:hypothetical protein
MFCSPLHRTHTGGWDDVCFLFQYAITLSVRLDHQSIGDIDQPRTKDRNLLDLLHAVGDENDF